MSRTRHLFLFDSKGRSVADIAGGSWDLKHGQVLPRHAHPEDQLLFAVKGVMTVNTEQGIWVVPPLRAIWIPAETVHSVIMSGRVSMRTLYFLPELCKTLPRKCLVINISALLRELILHACTFPRLQRAVPSEQHIIDLLIDQLKVIEALPIQLPHPRDPRARKLVKRLSSHPGDRQSFSQLCSECGASVRTMQRIFVEETAMSFSRWRQRYRLIHALRGLAAGDPVTTVAFDSGYGSTSAFIAMFRKQLGMTPTRYLSGKM